MKTVKTNATTLGHRRIKWFDMACDSIKAIQRLPKPTSIEKACKAVEQVVMDNSDSATTKKQIRFATIVLQNDILTHRI